MKCQHCHKVIDPIGSGYAICPQCHFGICVDCLADLLASVVKPELVDSPCLKIN